VKWIWRRRVVVSPRFAPSPQFKVIFGHARFIQLLVSASANAPALSPAFVFFLL
jgi:hypothetical protein